jgi:hypothetical protein
MLPVVEVVEMAGEEAKLWGVEQTTLVMCNAKSASKEITLLWIASTGMINNIKVKILKILRMFLKLHHRVIFKKLMVLSLVRIFHLVLEGIMDLFYQITMHSGLLLLSICHLQLCLLMDLHPTLLLLGIQTQGLLFM